MPRMNHDDALSLVTDALADRWVHQDPWHELSVGALTRDQVIAMRQGCESPDELEHKLALFQPPTEEAREQTLQALLRRHASPDGSTLGTAASTQSTQEGGNVVSLASARRSWKLPAIVGAILVAASAVLFASLSSTPPAGPAVGVERAHLPGFELQLDGGWSGDLRGADGADQPTVEGCDERYHQEQSLSVRLHPSEALGDALLVAIYAQGESGDGHWIPAAALEPKLSDDGVLAIEQPVAKLGLATGAWTLAFYVVRDGEALDLAWLRQLEPGAHPGVTVVRGTICVVD